MGLPVGRIMEEVEHELRHMDDELSDEVDVNMEVEEEADDNMEVEEEVDDNMENELDGIILEVVDGIKEGSRWLIVDDVHICHKQQVWVWPNPMLMFMSVYQVCLHSKIILGY